jgi:hypothetical protein
LLVRADRYEASPTGFGDVQRAVASTAVRDEPQFGTTIPVAGVRLLAG